MWEEGEEGHSLYLFCKIMSGHEGSIRYGHGLGLGVGQTLAAVPERNRHLKNPCFCDMDRKKKKGGVGKTEARRGDVC